MKELGPCEVQGHFSLALAEKTQHSTTVWLGPTQLQGYRPSHRQGPGESRYQPPPGRIDGSESQGGVGVPWPAFGVQVLPLPNAEPLGQMASLMFRTQAQLQTLATLAPFPSSRAITSGEESIVVLRGEKSRYLRYDGTYSCLPPASRCLSRDRKPRHSSSPRVRRVPRWHTVVR